MIVRDLEQISRNSYILVGVIEILRQNDTTIINGNKSLLYHEKGQLHIRHYRTKHDARFGTNGKQPPQHSYILMDDLGFGDIAAMDKKK